MFRCRVKLRRQRRLKRRQPRNLTLLCRTQPAVRIWNCNQSSKQATSTFRDQKGAL